MLTERCQTAWEKINRMKEVQFQLNLDLNDKKEVLQSDQDMLTLHKDCANISFKPDSLRVHKRLNFDLNFHQQKINYFFIFFGS